MNDEPVDDALKALEAALDVTPSAEFGARVRTQLGNQSVPGSWRWPALGAVAAIVALLAGAVWLTPRSTREPDRSAVRSAVRGPGPDVAAPARSEPEAARSSRAVRPVARRALPQAVAPSQMASGEPEVLVPPDQAIALGRLLGALRNGRASVPPEGLTPVQASVVLPDLPPIEIQLIKIEPLAVLPSEGSERRDL